MEDRPHNGRGSLVEVLDEGPIRISDFHADIVGEQTIGNATARFERDVALVRNPAGEDENVR
jgi:hypothetical protein